MTDSSLNKAEFLQNLPSQGNFVHVVPQSQKERIGTYIADHDTSPPEYQRITTDKNNILIRALTLKKRHSQEGSKKDQGNVSGQKGKEKRKGLEREMLPTKRPNQTLSKGSLAPSASSSESSVMSSSTTLYNSDQINEDNVYQMSVMQLKEFLRSKGRPTTGKKDDLASRVKTYLSQSKRARVGQK